jgi:hypothetical protein
MTLIGFGSKRERGKDEICNYIVSISDFRRDCFSYSLKEGIGKGVFGLTDEQLYGKLKKVVDPYWGMTPREILQKAGTEAMRYVFGEDIWIKTLFRRFEQENRPTVVSDVRFKSEAEAIKSRGGYLVRVDRYIPFDPEVDTHQSETDLDDWRDWDLVDNKGTLDDLYEAAEEFLNRVCG